MQPTLLGPDEASTALWAGALIVLHLGLARFLERRNKDMFRTGFDAESATNEFNTIEDAKRHARRYGLNVYNDKGKRVFSSQ